MTGDYSILQVLLIIVVVGGIIWYFSRDKSHRENTIDHNNRTYYSGNSYTRPGPDYKDSSSDQTDNPITAKVVGVTYENRQETIRQLVIGEKLLLKKEPENIYDKNAIMVLSLQGNKIGYLNKELAAQIQHYFKSSLEIVDAEVLNIIGNLNLGQNLGVIIKIYPPIHKVNISSTTNSFETKKEETPSATSYLAPGKKFPIPFAFYNTSSMFKWYLNYFSFTDAEIAQGVYDEEERMKRYVDSRKKNHRNFNIMKPLIPTAEDLEEFDFEAEYRLLKDRYQSYIKEHPKSK